MNIQLLVRRSLDLALLALLALAVLMVITTTALPALGYQVMAISSGSMSPTIPTGSLILINEHQVNVQVGDVVSIRIPSSGIVFTHRVVGMVDIDGQPGLQTQGDANDQPDAKPSPVAWVVGRVETSAPELGRIAGFLQSGTGRAALLSAFVVVLALRWFDQDETRPGRAGAVEQGA